MVRSVAARFAGWWQHRDLDVQFAIVASVVVTSFMTLLGAWVSDRIVRGVVANSAANGALYLHGFVEPHVQELAKGGKLSAATIDRIDSLFENQMLRDKIVSIKLWAPGGYVAYSRDHRQIGQVFPETSVLKEAWKGHVATEYDHLDDEENRIERRLNLPVLEIYSPVFAASDNKVIAVAEIYQIATELRSELRASYVQTALSVAALTLVMLASLFQIVRRGAKTISQQKSALSHRVDELSRSLELNRVLQRKVSDANRRAAEANEQFLRQIGAELHDGPAQLISLGLLRLDALKPGSGGKPRSADAVEHDFGVVRGALADSLKEIRSLCAGITIPELRHRSLAQAIELSARMHERRTGSSVELNLDGGLPEHLPLPIVICAYRFVQEGLNNAFRHAGGKDQRVTATAVGSRLVLTVSDSGPGIALSGSAAAVDKGAAAPGTGQLGLRGLRDRILAMGGEFQISSEPGSGTRLEAAFSIEELGMNHG